MVVTTLLFGLLAASAAAAPPWQHGPPRGPHVSNSLVVSTTSGQVHGKVDPNLPNVHQYLGIPYAVPPVGDLRWTAPALLDQPNAQVEATRLPPSCMQFLTNQGNSLYVRDVLEFNLQGLNRTGNITEDCLTLSVWTPSNATSGHAEHGGRHHGQPNHSNTNNNNNSSQGLPVLIFIYGGSFQTGGQDVPYQIPAQWVNRTADHIVVSFNYRVNIFGFPNAGGLEEQNLGLLDQRAAVEWCRQNIAAFGGDPARMVLWGQSAGSISVDYYNFAYPSDPIVTGLIMNSGTANSPTSVNDTTHANFTFVAEHVGCAGLGGDAAQQLACMRGVNANTIEDFLATYQEGGNTPALSFDPVVDGKIIFQNYTERARASQQAKIPAIIGTDAQDGVPFAPYNPSGPDPAAVLQALLRIFFCPATQSIRLRQETSRLTYRYLYAGNFTNVSPRPWMGAYHAGELPMLMGTHPDFRGPSSALEYATSQAFQDAYVAFARDPVNGLKGLDWVPYSQLGSDEVREFGKGVPAQDTNVAANEALCDGAVPRASA